AWPRYFHIFLDITFMEECMGEVRFGLSGRRLARAILLGSAVGVSLVGCADNAVDAVDATSAAQSAQFYRKPLTDGRAIFRFDDWRFWTDTLRLNDVVETLTPNAALQLGLKVDADAVPAQVLQAVTANPALLDDPATTLALLSLDAVVGVKATVAGNQITRL